MASQHERIRAIVVIKWLRGQRNDPDLLDKVNWINTDGYSDSICDITNQPDERIGKLATNIYLVEVDVTLATWNTEITSRTDIFPLATERRDVVMDVNKLGEPVLISDIVTSSTYDAVPTAGQLTTFATQLKARFPGLTDEQLRRAGQNILRAGLTRRQIIAELIERFGQL
jgi:hypothetical protein